MKRVSPANVTEYLSGFPPGARAALRQVRAAIRRALPEAEEVISYRIPAYKVDGRVAIYFAGWTKHYSLYPADARLVAKFKHQLAPYEVNGKGTIRFPLAEPVPAGLIAAIARDRATRARERARARTAAIKKR